MPLIKSAIKKVKQDKKKAARNRAKDAKFKKALKTYEGAIKSKKKVALSAIYKTVDRAQSAKLIHKNKAARLKSKFSKLLKKR